MKISENHIEQLYKFTREHFVYHYDVQTELVNHSFTKRHKILALWMLLNKSKKR